MKKCINVTLSKVSWFSKPEIGKFRIHLSAFLTSSMIKNTAKIIRKGEQYVIPYEVQIRKKLQKKKLEGIRYKSVEFVKVYVTFDKTKK
jgi:hypothetical protein